MNFRDSGLAPLVVAAVLVVSTGAQAGPIDETVDAICVSLEGEAPACGVPASFSLTTRSSVSLGATGVPGGACSARIIHAQVLAQPGAPATYSWTLGYFFSKAGPDDSWFDSNSGESNVVIEHSIENIEFSGQSGDRLHVWAEISNEQLGALDEAISFLTIKCP